MDITDTITAPTNLELVTDLFRAFADQAGTRLTPDDTERVWMLAAEHGTHVSEFELDGRRVLVKIWRPLGWNGQAYLLLSSTAGVEEAFTCTDVREAMDYLVSWAKVARILQRDRT